jgi:hypothetical protein
VEVTANGNQPGNIVEVSIVSPTYSWMLQGPAVLRTNDPLTFRVYAYDVLGGLPLGLTGVTL